MKRIVSKIWQRLKKRGTEIVGYSVSIGFSVAILLGAISPFKEWWEYLIYILYCMALAAIAVILFSVFDDTN